MCEIRAQKKMFVFLAQLPIFLPHLKVNPMTAHTFKVFPFRAYDGFGCNLWRLKQDAATPRGPVLLVHGAGVSANIFNPPNTRNLLDVLAEAGYDVWLENWRASTEFAPNQWDLDQAAAHDHPAAVAEVLRVTGSATLKAVIHCQGSTSFMISAVRGLVPEVTTVISNAVSLHPVVPRLSGAKLRYLLPFVKSLTPYLNPHWGKEAPNGTARFFRTLVEMTHWEKDTRVGKMVSFTYGAGHPALWELDNLSPETLEWITGEFGCVPVSFFAHIRKCVEAGALVSRDGSRHYAKTRPATDARFVFFAGKKNKCFLSASQEESFRYFDRLKPGFHQLYEYDQYSHLDIFFGKHADRDIFPAMVRELNE